jgi:hypothetical protein
MKHDYPYLLEVQQIASVVAKTTNHPHVYVISLGRSVLTPESERPVVGRTADKEALKAYGWGESFG